MFALINKTKQQQSTASRRKHGLAVPDNPTVRAIRRRAMAQRTPGQLDEVSWPPGEAPPSATAYGSKGPSPEVSTSPPPGPPPAPPVTPTPAPSATCQVMQFPNAPIPSPSLTLRAGNADSFHDGNVGFTIKAGDIDNQGRIILAGMFFAGGATLSSASCNGQLLLVQNILVNRRFEYQDGSRADRTTQGFVLDTCNPYPAAPTNARLPRLSVLSGDAPHQATGIFWDDLARTEALISAMSVHDQFRMYLIFQPQGGSRQTLMRGGWTFQGVAVNQGGRLQGSGERVTAGQVAISSESPDYATNSTTVLFQVTNSPGQQGRSSADMFVRLLNAGVRRGHRQCQPSP